MAIEKVKSAPAKRAADVVEKVYGQVKEMAVDYRFRPGERINEVELAQRLKVSRTPVRQALSRLVLEGFVTFVPNRGFFCREIDPADIGQIYEFRALVECGAFLIACERAADEDIAAIRAAWDLMSHQGDDWEKIGIADEEFHISIARLAGNPHVVATLTDLNAKLRFFRKIDLENPARREKTYLEHAAILDSLARRDTAGADVLKRHIVFSSAHAIEVTKEGLARIFFGKTI